MRNRQPSYEIVPFPERVRVVICAEIKIAGRRVVELSIRPLGAETASCPFKDATERGLAV